MFSSSENGICFARVLFIGKVSVWQIWNIQVFSPQRIKAAVHESLLMYPIEQQKVWEEMQAADLNHKEKTKQPAISLPALMGLDNNAPVQPKRDKFFYASPLIAQRLVMLNHFVNSLKNQQTRRQHLNHPILKLPEFRGQKHFRNNCSNLREL